MGLDAVAFEAYLAGFFVAFAKDHQIDFGADFPAHQLYGFAQGQPFYKGIVDFEDQVARENAGVAGGRVIHRGDHFDKAVFHGDFDAQAAEFAGGGHLQVVKLVRGQVVGVRVQIVEHAADGGFQQFTVIHVFNVGRTDAFHDLGKGAQLVHRDALLAGLLIKGRVLGVKCGERAQGKQAGERDRTERGQDGCWHSGSPAGTEKRCARFKVHHQFCANGGSVTR